MSEHLTRIRVLKIILEAVKGTGLAATNALRVENPITKNNTTWTERGSTGATMGSDQGDASGPIVGQSTFDTELKGNGSTGADSALAILLQACGLKKVSEVYSVHSVVADQKTISLNAWEDRKKKILTGASGNLVLTAIAGERAMFGVTLDGLYGEVTDEAVPAHAPGTESPMYFQGGVVTIGGTARKIANVSLDFGMLVNMAMDGSAETGVNYFRITGYPSPIISVDPEEELVAAYDDEGKYRGATTAAIVLTFTDGTVKCTIDAPAAQMIQLDPGDREGIAIYDMNFKCLNSSGNDAFSLTFAADA